MKLLLLVAVVVFATVADLLFGSGEHVRAFLVWTHETSWAVREWVGALV